MVQVFAWHETAFLLHVTGEHSPWQRKYLRTDSSVKSFDNAWHVITMQMTDLACILQHSQLFCVERKDEINFMGCCFLQLPSKHGQTLDLTGMFSCWCFAIKKYPSLFPPHYQILKSKQKQIRYVRQPQHKEASAGLYRLRFKWVTLQYQIFIKYRLYKAFCFIILPGCITLALF